MSLSLVILISFLTFLLGWGVGISRRSKDEKYDDWDDDEASEDDIP